MQLLPAQVSLHTLTLRRYAKIHLSAVTAQSMHPLEPVGGAGGGWKVVVARFQRSACCLGMHQT